MQKRIVMILICFTMFLLIGCSDSSSKVSLESEFLAIDAPKVGSSEDRVEDYWKNAANYDLAKEQISVENTSKFNSNYQEDTKVYYDMGSSNGLSKCTSIGMSTSDFETLKDKSVSDVISIAKSFINQETKFNIGEEELKLTKDSSNNKKISYYLYLNSKDVVSDDYEGNLNGDNNPYEEIIIIKDHDGISLQVGSLRTRHYRETEYIDLNPNLIKDESKLNEILNLENTEAIKKEYLLEK